MNYHEARELTRRGMVVMRKDGSAILKRGSTPGIYIVMRGSQCLDVITGYRAEREHPEWSDVIEAASY